MGRLSLGSPLYNRDEPPVEAAPMWRTVVALVLSLAGLGVSIYLTIDHFAKIKLVCSDTGVINCQKVTTSGESYFLHIPVALLGLIFYTAMVALSSPWAWRSRDRRVHLARLVAICVGMGFALWLVSAEALIIHNVCLWCTSVHVITFCLFVLILATVPRMLSWGYATPHADGYEYGSDADEEWAQESEKLEPASHDAGLANEGHLR
jgi:uncharacterized membrane protein